jgi:hypothetical protein
VAGSAAARPKPFRSSAPLPIKWMNGGARPGSGSEIMWHVHYNTKGASGLYAANALPLAIKRACELLDQGADVSCIESGGEFKGIYIDEIRRLCAEAKAKAAPH